MIVPSLSLHTAHTRHTVKQKYTYAGLVCVCVHKGFERSEIEKSMQRRSLTLDQNLIGHRQKKSVLVLIKGQRIPQVMWKYRAKQLKTFPQRLWTTIIIGNLDYKLLHARHWVHNTYLMQDPGTLLCRTYFTYSSNKMSALRGLLNFKLQNAHQVVPNEPTLQQTDMQTLHALVSDP